MHFTDMSKSCLAVLNGNYQILLLAGKAFPLQDSAPPCVPVSALHQNEGVCASEAQCPPDRVLDEIKDPTDLKLRQL